ncbi:MAG: hypothetical protein V4658_11215 [Bacteroidota bacterium]
MSFEQNNNILITRLTALWALSESGLGGLMHALKIPFTGFFLGGFAVVIIILMAHHSTGRFKTIIQATLLVVLVKATVSPHSPPMAYIAVSFQGLAGALILQLPLKRIAAILFGMIALFESAIQKFLVMTLIFGKSMWEALDLFFKGILKDLSFIPDFSFSFWLITIYTFVYTVWGMLLGFWASGLPLSMMHKKESILLQYSTLENETPGITPGRKKGRSKKLLGVFFILLFVSGIFILKGDDHKAWFVVLRTIAVLLALFFIVNPLIKWLIKRWAGKNKNGRQQQLASIIDLLPELRNYLLPAMQLARQNAKGLLVYKAFVVNLIILALYQAPANEN